MGLFKFLKEKLSKKKNDNTEQQSLDKYNKGLEKSRINFSNKLDGLAKKYKEVNEDYFNDLEEILIEADCGIEFTLQIISEILETSKEQKITNPKDINELLVDKMFYDYLKDGEDIHNEIEFNHKPEVLLMVGVNGVGKTTTIAKIAYRYQKVGKRILLVAADTFRAGAIDQLKIWAERVGCECITKPEGSDPASVMYEAIQKAKNENVDVLLCDTAGRLQTKVNLMKELEKVHRVISREVPNAPHDTLLVIDATTGQNGMNQAKAFTEATNVSGIVLTKIDGTAKGGIVLAIRNELGVPIKFVTMGEKITDLEYFDIEQYIFGLFSDLFE